MQCVHLITAIAYYLNSHSYPHPMSVYSLCSRKSKCSPHSSPGKFLFAFVREYYRNHNQSKYRVVQPSPNICIYNVTPIPKTQGPLSCSHGKGRKGYVGEIIGKRYSYYLKNIKRNNLKTQTNTVTTPPKICWQCLILFRWRPTPPMRFLGLMSTGLAHFPSFLIELYSSYSAQRWNL